MLQYLISFLNFIFSAFLSQTKVWFKLNMAKLSSSTTIVTRKNTDVWLVGQTSSDFIQTKLPSKKAVLSVFFYHKNEKKKKTVGLRESAHSTADDVLDIWSRARIPTRLKKHVVAKLENMYKEWQNLKK